MKTPSLLVLGLALNLAACTSAITPETLAKIKPAMKATEVEALLGRPAHIDHAETTGLQGDVYIYPASTGTERVIFLNDAVFKDEFIPGAKS